jgi:hypothetical protein
MGDPDAGDRPDWWLENERLREEMALPEYVPPRFSDGTYTHEVVPELEERFDCSILFLGHNTVYPDQWEVQVDGETVMHVGHLRDGDGNTVYEIDAATFRSRLAAALGEG